VGTRRGGDGAGVNDGAQEARESQFSVAVGTSIESSRHSHRYDPSPHFGIAESPPLAIARSVSLERRVVA
jgi:hypothetical protein